MQVFFLRRKYTQSPLSLAGARNVQKKRSWRGRLEGERRGRLQTQETPEAKSKSVLKTHAGNHPLTKYIYIYFILYRVYIYIYAQNIHIYIYIYIYTYIYIYVYIYTYIYTHIYLCIYIESKYIYSIYYSYVYIYIYKMKYITVFVCRFVFLPKSHISFGNAEPSRMRYHQSSAPCPSRPFPLASGIRRLRRSGWRTASKISSWAGNFWISEKMQDSWFFAELGGSVFFGLCSLTSINSQHQGLLKCCF